MAEILRFFGFFSGFFSEEIDLSEDQVFEQTEIPRRQRRQHTSVVVNQTTGVDILVYISPMGQVKTVMRAAADIGAHAPGAGGSVGLGVDSALDRKPAGLQPQWATIPPGKSHRFHIPRCGWWTHKARVSIVTTPTEPEETRVEAGFTLREHTKLTVKMPTAGGRVRGRPAGDEEILERLSMHTRAANTSPTTTAGGTPAG